MANMTVTVKGVNVFVNGNKTRVQLTINQMVKQLVQERDDEGHALGFDHMSEKEVAVIKMPMSKLIAQLCDKSDDIALYVAMLDKTIGKKELVLLLLGSQLTISHNFFAEKEVIGEGDDAYIVEHDSYITDVKDVVLCERAKSYIEKFMFM